MISVQKLYDIIDFHMLDEITPLEVKDEDGNTGRIEQANQDFAGITITGTWEEILLDNLGWLYIADLHDVMKKIFEVPGLHNKWRP